MVLAHHVIFTTYGFWLPNDPRGSWSDFVRNWELLKFGPATKVTTRRSLARDPHDRALRRAAKDALRYDPVRFTGRQALSVGRGFARAIEESGYVVFACSVLPDHVHLVLRRHTHTAEQMAGHLKTRATQQLLADGLHPFGAFREANGKPPPAWVRRAWKVFLNSTADVERAARYVEGNPPKEGKRVQRWSFVTTCERTLMG